MEANKQDDSTTHPQHPNRRSESESASPTSSRPSPHQMAESHSTLGGTLIGAAFNFGRRIGQWSM